MNPESAVLCCLLILSRRVFVLLETESDGNSVTNCKGPSSDGPRLTLAAPKAAQPSPVRKGPLQWQTLPETHGSSTTQPGCKGPREDPSDPAARSML
ncbi:hypothetical protein G5714_023733 [Onychostoma macrolepis]|uniref:Secreted protein n=1 Tax=Onychostoma macrolepis TaxID=369639 RepID=A0A7J6BM36_9TELE|nr:hypothetical protein G5714_023733 [Onychostoma macrolepis]